MKTKKIIEIQKEINSLKNNKQHLSIDSLIKLMNINSRLNLISCNDNQIIVP